jgi:hypothetical protein
MVVHFGMIHARSDYTKRIQDAAALIPTDEPVFLLRGQDPLAYRVAMYWADLYAAQPGADPRVTTMVRKHAAGMRDWAKATGNKLADVPEAVIENG